MNNKFIDSEIKKIDFSKNTFNIPTSSHIYIYHGERHDKKLMFMYEPFRETLYKIFKNYKCTFLYNNLDISNFRYNDVLIFIGMIGIPNFKIFKQKKIYTMWYYTEPYFLNYNEIKYCDKILLYSKYHFLNQRKMYKNQSIFFIPIIPKLTKFKTNYLKKTNLKLCFLGKIKLRNRMDDFLNMSQFIDIYNLFDNHIYNSYMVNNTNIYLNINKMDTKFLPFARICKLLSHKCIVISEHCNLYDEQLFEGMVFFCHLKDIKKKFHELSMKSPQELEQISVNHYIKFIKKFCIKNKDLFLLK